MLALFESMTARVSVIGWIMIVLAPFLALYLLSRQRTARDKQAKIRLMVLACRVADENSKILTDTRSQNQAAGRSLSAARQDSQVDIPATCVFAYVNPMGIAHYFRFNYPISIWNYFLLTSSYCPLSRRSQEFPPNF
jgi:hypothetical protein